MIDHSNNEHSVMSFEWVINWDFAWKHAIRIVGGGGVERFAEKTEEGER